MMSEKILKLQFTVDVAVQISHNTKENGIDTYGLYNIVKHINTRYLYVFTQYNIVCKVLIIHLLIKTVSQNVVFKTQLTFV